MGGGPRTDLPACADLTGDNSAVVVLVRQCRARQGGVSGKRSKSRASRRKRVSHTKLRSTTQRSAGARSPASQGATSPPRAARPARPPPARDRRRCSPDPRRPPSTCPLITACTSVKSVPAWARSCSPAGVTVSVSGWPSVSTTMCSFEPYGRSCMANTPRRPSGDQSSAALTAKLRAISIGRPELPVRRLVGLSPHQ